MGYHHGGSYRVGYNTGPVMGANGARIIVTVIIVIVIVSVAVGVGLSLSAGSRDCPTITLDFSGCPTCTSFRPEEICVCSNCDGPVNATNATTLPPVITCTPTGETIETCWEWLRWDDLSAAMQKDWMVLGQSQEAWDANSDPEYDCWDYMSSDEIDAAVDLGWTKFTWDFGSSCGGNYGGNYYYYYNWYSYYYSYYYNTNYWWY